MTKRDALKNPDSCLNKADAEEPVFVLRAKDPVAPQTIRHWAAMAVGEHEREKIKDALAVANQMERWAGRNAPAVAEFPSPPNRDLEG